MKGQMMFAEESTIGTKRPTKIPDFTLVDARDLIHDRPIRPEAAKAFQLTAIKIKEKEKLKKMAGNRNESFRMLKYISYIFLLVLLLFSLSSSSFANIQ